MTGTWGALKADGPKVRKGGKADVRLRPSSAVVLDLRHADYDAFWQIRWGFDRMLVFSQGNLLAVPSPTTTDEFQRVGAVRQALQSITSVSTNPGPALTPIIGNGPDGRHHAITTHCSNNGARRRRGGRHGFTGRSEQTDRRAHRHQHPPRTPRWAELQAHGAVGPDQRPHAVLSRLSQKSFSLLHRELGEVVHGLGTGGANAVTARRLHRVPALTAGFREGNAELAHGMIVFPPPMSAMGRQRTVGYER